MWRKPPEIRSRSDAAILRHRQEAVSRQWREPRRLRASTMSGPCLNLAESASSTRESVQALRHESKGNGINFCHAIFGRQFRRGMRLTSRKCPRRAATDNCDFVWPSSASQSASFFVLLAGHASCMPHATRPHAACMPTASSHNQPVPNSNHGEQEPTTDLSA